MQSANHEPVYAACLCLLDALVLCLCASCADVREDDGRDGGTFANAGSEAAPAAANIQHITSQPVDTRLQVSMTILAPFDSMIAAFQCVLDQLLIGWILQFWQFSLACSGRGLGCSSAAGHNCFCRRSK